MKRRIHNVRDQTTAQQVLAEWRRREQLDSKVLFDRSRHKVQEHEWAQLLAQCRQHDKQRELLLDETRFKALLCPRRTGKTTYNLLEVLLHDLKFPGSMIAYVVPDSKAHAKDLFWLPLKELDKKLRLNFVFKEVEKRVITPRGTNILILGAHDEGSPTRLRGNPYSLVLLDECKDFGPHFEELVVEAVVPGLGDYGGTLVLSGTPGPLFAGLFYKITTERPEGWTVAHWHKSDNGYLRAEERDLEKVWQTSYKPFGVPKDSPKFLREQKAEWVTDDSERAYFYNAELNGFDGTLKPGMDWQYLCGIDLGKRDKLVIQPAAFSPYCKDLVYLPLFAKSGMIIEQAFQKWSELNKQYQFASTVVDTGGLGVMIVDDINHRYGVNWQAAKKGPGYKLSAVEQMNNDFLLGNIKADPNSAIASAWLRSIKNPKNGLPMHSDECDAALYLHRHSYHWQGEDVAPPPTQDTPEWWLRQEQEALANAVKNRKSSDRIYGHAVSDDN